MTRYRGYWAAGALLCAAAVFGLVGCPPHLPGQWFRVLGSPTGDDAAFAVAQCDDGGYVLAGYVEEDPEADHRASLVKLSACGWVEWEGSYGDERDDCALAVQPIADGFIVAGRFGGEQDPSSDAFLLKTNKKGVELWKRTFDSGGEDSALSVVQTTDGGFLLALAFDVAGTAEAVMLKTDANGTEQWRVSAGEHTHASRAIELADGGCMLGWWEILPSEVLGSVTGIVGLLRVNAAGGQETRTVFTENQPYELNDLRQTTDGGWVLAGQGDLLLANSTVFLWKLNSEGQLAWRKTFGDESRDTVQTVRQTKDGGYILAGETHPFNENPHAYLIKTDAFGNLDWERFYGSDDMDVATDAIQTRDGGYLLAGYSESYGREDEPDSHAMLAIKTCRRGHSIGIEITED